VSPRLAVGVLGLAFASCGEPTAYRCSTNAQCQDGSAQGVCTRENLCALTDQSCASGLRYDESAGMLAGQCIIAGDDPSAPLPLEPSQTVDLQGAHDDYTPSCGMAGGPDIFFETTLTQPGRLYVDTFGTSFDVILAIHSGPCATLGAELACLAASCTAEFQQWSADLPAGTYCVIADQAHAATTLTLTVRSVLGPSSPLGQVGTNVGNTCTEDVWTGACGRSSTPEQTWFFMTCAPQVFTASACVVQPGFEGDLQAWGLGNSALGCDTGCTPMSVSQTEPGPLFIVEEAASLATCGSAALDVETTKP
jgi:hypothetical protein